MAEAGYACRRLCCAGSTLIIFSHVTDKKCLLLSMLWGWKRQTPDDVIKWFSPKY